MLKTQNYNLNKPEGTDYAKIDVLNQNADIIDQKLKENADNIASTNEVFTEHLAEFETFETTTNNHISNKSNPHNVTADQIGAYKATGGNISGDVSISGKKGMTIRSWGTLTSNSGGEFIVGSNVYTDTNNLYKFLNSHANFGARGLLFDWGDGTLNTLKFFDTGNVPTTTDEIFTPTLYKVWHEGNAPFKVGTGSPEGVITASVGTLYLRADGSTSTTLYVKTSGTGNTGWTAK